jgi:predicted ATPase
MSRQFFVNPKAVTRLYPWGEDADNKQWWIEVKDVLSAKEEKDVQAAGIPHMLQKPADKDVAAEQREVKMGLDVGRMSIVRAAKYVVRWSLVDETGQPMPLNEATIGELDPDSFDAIDKALDAHKAAVAAKKAQAQAGATGAKSA